jgi:hypothetical protein
MKKRIVVLLSVVALMVVMLASSVAPASATRLGWDCIDPNRALPDVHADSKAQKDLFESQGYVCTKVKKPHRV